VLAGLVGAAVAFGLYMYLAPEPWQTTVETTSPLPGGLEHADIFSDCADCPSMVAIGGGQLLMGAPADDITKGIYTADQGPQRLVSVAPFAIGQYEVTKAQYTAFLSASDHQAPKGCRVWADGTSTTSDSHSFTDPGYEQEETHPAVCVSWNDAKAYVDWLSRETGESYRLLSEAEWEFAARAGSNARFFFGEDVTDICRYDNIGDATALSRWPNWETASCSDGRLFTSPVGTYEANGFGLYDLYGNAREWVQDCWFNNFKNAPETAKARDRDGCERRAIRGGSWDSKPSLVGSTWRWSLPAEHRDFLYGFRVARDLR
jgi:formylglycine-generating enzyme required for sulfatase activity